MKLNPLSAILLAATIPAFAASYGHLKAKETRAILKLSEQCQKYEIDPQETNTDINDNDLDQDHDESRAAFCDRVAGPEGSDMWEECFTGISLDDAMNGGDK